MLLCALSLLAALTCLNACGSGALLLSQQSPPFVARIFGCVLLLHTLGFCQSILPNVAWVALLWLVSDPVHRMLLSHIQSKAATKLPGSHSQKQRWVLVNAVLAAVTLLFSLLPLAITIRLPVGAVLLAALLFKVNAETGPKAELFSPSNLSSMDGVAACMVPCCRVLLGTAAIATAVMGSDSTAAWGISHAATLLVMVLTVAMVNMLSHVTFAAHLMATAPHANRYGEGSCEISRSLQDAAAETFLSGLSGYSRSSKACRLAQEMISNIEAKVENILKNESLEFPSRLLELGELFRISEASETQDDDEEEEDALLQALMHAASGALSQISLISAANMSQRTSIDAANTSAASDRLDRNTSFSKLNLNDPALKAHLLGDDGLSWKVVVEALSVHSSELAHDMKNPLNGVLALSQNVVAGTFGEIPKVASDQLNVVRSCAYHLLNMINMERDMLKMLNGGDAELSLNLSQTSNQVEEVLKRMTPMIGTRLTVTYEPIHTHFALADDQRLYQVLHCVIANAFKYTRKGNVTIDTFASADGLYTTFRCVDTGTGFTAEQRDKFNGPVSVSCSEQLGLGLLLVKRLMALFGGLLRLSNRDVGGACVELIFRANRDAPSLVQGDHIAAAAAASSAFLSALSGQTSTSMPSSSTSTPSHAAAAPPPAAVPSAAAPAAATPAAGPPAPPKSSGSSGNNSASRRRVSHDKGSGPGNSSAQVPLGHHDVDKIVAVKEGNNSHSGTEMMAGNEEVTILIVDDDPVNMTILEDLLKGAGYDTLLAGTGTEALEVYLTCDPPVKLVLLDVTLPDMSGHEVCLKMRSLTPGVPPPIIMISGKASTKDVIKGLQAGSSDYITKPFQPQEVLARIDCQLRLFMGEVQQLQDAAERNVALLSQILPPHVLSNLKGGTRIMVEKWPDVVVLSCEIVGFANLAANANTSDCILSLNRIFSSFDTLTDKFGVHKVDVLNDCYIVGIGNRRGDNKLSPVEQLTRMVECAKEMLQVVRTVPYPATLGKMELRVGIHVGPVYAGVLGIKYPRYCLFGSTARLAVALQNTTVPMTIHISEMVYNRLKGAGAYTCIPFTSSVFTGMGIIKTYLIPTEHFDPGSLEGVHVPEYLNALVPSTALQVMQPLLGLATTRNFNQPSNFPMSNMAMSFNQSSNSSYMMSNQPDMLPHSHCGLNDSLPGHSGNLHDMRTTSPTILEDEDEELMQPATQDKVIDHQRGVMDFMADQLKADRSQEIDRSRSPTPMPITSRTGSATATTAAAAAPAVAHGKTAASTNTTSAATTAPTAAAAAPGPDANSGGTGAGAGANASDAPAVQHKAGGTLVSAAGPQEDPRPQPEEGLQRRKTWDQVDEVLLTQMGLSPSLSNKVKEMREAQIEEVQQRGIQEAKKEHQRRQQADLQNKSNLRIPRCSGSFNFSQPATLSHTLGLPYMLVTSELNGKMGGGGGSGMGGGGVAAISNGAAFGSGDWVPSGREGREGRFTGAVGASGLASNPAVGALANGSSFMTKSNSLGHISPIHSPISTSLQVSRTGSFQDITGEAAGPLSVLYSPLAPRSSLGATLGASASASYFSAIPYSPPAPGASPGATLAGASVAASYSSAIPFSPLTVPYSPPTTVATRLTQKGLRSVSCAPASSNTSAASSVASVVHSPSTFSPYQLQGASSGPPKSVDELFTRVQLGYYSKVISDQGLTLQDLAVMDDVALRKAGLVTARSRQIVTDELYLHGLKK